LDSAHHKAHLLAAGVYDDTTLGFTTLLFFFLPIVFKLFACFFFTCAMSPGQSEILECLTKEAGPTSPFFLNDLFDTLRFSPV